MCADVRFSARRFVRGISLVSSRFSQEDAMQRFPTADQSAAAQSDRVESVWTGPWAICLSSFSQLLHNRRRRNRHHGECFNSSEASDSLCGLSILLALCRPGIGSPFFVRSKSFAGHDVIFEIAGAIFRQPVEQSGNAFSQMRERTPGQC